MSELSFLPDWYQVRQERRRGYFMLVWLGASLLTVMGVWFYLAHSRISECRAGIQLLKAERVAVDDHLLKIDRLRAVRDDLARKSKIADKLHNRPDVIHVVSRLMEVLPEDISLIDMQFQSEAVQDAAAEAARPAGPRARPAASAQPAVRPDPRVRYQLRATGVAPADLTIGNFIACMTQCDAFTDVQVSYTQDLKRNGRLMRQFDLTCRMVDDWKMSSGAPDRPAEGADVRPARPAAAEGRPAGAADELVKGF